MPLSTHHPAPESALSVNWEELLSAVSIFSHYLSSPAYDLGGSMLGLISVPSFTDGLLTFPF